VEELLTDGYIHMQTNLHTSRRTSFDDWCEQNAIGVIEEIKFIKDETEPYNIYVPAGLVNDAEELWSAFVSEDSVEAWKRFVSPTT
jgi:hypothetical protein